MAAQFRVQGYKHTFTCAMASSVTADKYDKSLQIILAKISSKKNKPLVKTRTLFLPIATQTHRSCVKIKALTARNYIISWKERILMRP